VVWSLAIVALSAVAGSRIVQKSFVYCHMRETWIWESRDGVQDEAACAGETEKGAHNVIKFLFDAQIALRSLPDYGKEAPTRPCTVPGLRPAESSRRG
jgi:hypothetical protein